MRPDVCPNCGAEVPAKAKACPGCGSDENTGWSETAYVGGLNLPDEFNYEEFAEREFGGKGKKVLPQGITWFWWAVATVLLIIFLWVWFKWML